MSGGIAVLRRLAARLTAVALLAAAGSVCGGCSVGKAMIAPSSDYAGYRRYRVAPRLDDRLAAAADYLREHPDGVYAASLRSWFDGVEPVFYAVRRRSMAGLEAYLQALPSGPHAEAALDELMRRRLRARRDEVRAGGAATASRRLDYERQQGEAASSLPARWTEMLMDRAAWSAPLERAPRELLLSYSLELPQPECHRDLELGVYRCSKRIGLGYPVVAEGESRAERIEMWVELELDDAWQLRAARLFGSALFVHAMAARAKRPSALDDPATRDAALEAFEAELLERLQKPGGGCAVTLGEDWTLACPERRVVVHRGGGDEDDTITIEPVR